MVGGGDHEIVKAAPDCPEEGGQGRRHQVRTGKLGKGAQAAVVWLKKMCEVIGAPEVAEVAHGGACGAALLRGRSCFRLHEPDRRGEKELGR